MAKRVYRNYIVDVLASAFALCSVVSCEREQMQRTACTVWSSRHARPPPQHLGEDVAGTM
jgi:hypothetical protein